MNLFAYYLISGFITDSTGALIDPELAQGAVLFAFIAGFFVTMLFSLSPMSSGYYYVLRNYADETHAWLLTDFIKHFKNNKKQSLITYFVDLLVAMIFMAGASIYMQTTTLISSAMWIPFIFFLIIGIAYAFTATYRWTMIVTLELKLKDIYKNSFLLIIGELLLCGNNA